MSKKSGDNTVTPVSSLSTVCSTRDGLKDGLSGIYGETLEPISSVLEEEIAASNGSYAFLVGQLESLGQFCALAVSANSLITSSWELEEMDRAPNGLGSVSNRYRGWQRAKLKEWGSFVLVGEKQAILLARAAPVCLASDVEGRTLRVQMTERLIELGVDPRPPHLWEADLMITPTACDYYNSLTLDE